MLIAGKNSSRTIGIKSTAGRRVTAGQIGTCRSLNSENAWSAEPFSNPKVVVKNFAPRSADVDIRSGKRGVGNIGTRANSTASIAANTSSRGTASAKRNSAAWNTGIGTLKKSGREIANRTEKNLEANRFICGASAQRAAERN